MTATKGQSAVALQAAGHSYDAIAAAIGSTPGSVRALLRREARKAAGLPKAGPGIVLGAGGVHGLVVQRQHQQAARMRAVARALSETRYRLRDRDGAYVHGLDVGERTREPAYAWIGYREHLEALHARHPELKSLSVIAVPPERRGVGVS